VDTSKNGWTNGFYGLFHDELEKSALSRETNYRLRYCRKGLYDALPSSATDYERALAVCADDVFYYGSMILHIRRYAPSESAAKVNTLFMGLRRDLVLILKRRAEMMKQEADRHGFKEAVSKTIHHYSDQISAGNHSFDFKLLVRLHVELEELLPPWFSVKGFWSVGELWKWVLGDMGKPIAKPSRGFERSETIPMAFGMARIMATDLKLESLRAKILKGADVDGEELEFLR
jgi:hypothetical protein